MVRPEIASSVETIQQPTLDVTLLSTSLFEVATLDIASEVGGKKLAKNIRGSSEDGRMWNPEAIESISSSFEGTQADVALLILDRAAEIQRTRKPAQKIAQKMLKGMSISPSTGIEAETETIYPELLSGLTDWPSSREAFQRLIDSQSKAVEVASVIKFITEPFDTLDDDEKNSGVYNTVKNRLDESAKVWMDNTERPLRRQVTEEIHAELAAATPENEHGLKRLAVTNNTIAPIAALFTAASAARIETVVGAGSDVLEAAGNVADALADFADPAQELIFSRRAGICKKDSFYLEIGEDSKTGDGLPSAELYMQVLAATSEHEPRELYPDTHTVWATYLQIGLKTISRDIRSEFDIHVLATDADIEWANEHLSYGDKAERSLGTLAALRVANPDTSQELPPVLQECLRDRFKEQIIKPLVLSTYQSSYEMLDHLQNRVVEDITHNNMGTPFELSNNTNTNDIVQALQQLQEVRLESLEPSDIEMTRAGLHVMGVDGDLLSELLMEEVGSDLRLLMLGGRARNALVSFFFNSLLAATRSRFGSYIDEGYLVNATKHMDTYEKGIMHGLLSIAFPEASKLMSAG